MEQVKAFLSWTPPGKSLVIRLDQSVIDRLNIEVMRGFGVTRRRGTETGGLLIGTIDPSASPPVIHVQDFEVVPCEYATGPSYVLSANDRKQFRDAASRWQPALDRASYTIGYFRSHTREGFALDTHDGELFREFFFDPLNIALLVKPFATRAAQAGFFLQEKGSLALNQCAVEFVFSSRQKPKAERESTKTPSTQVAPKPEEKAPASTTSDRPMFEQPLQQSSPFARGFGWAAFCLALLAFGGVCGYEYAGARAQQQRQAPISSGQDSPEANRPEADLYSAQLEVTRSESSLLLRWNRDSAPIEAALYGVLSVSQGASSKEVKLGFAELRTGSIMYPAVDEFVQFRLELFFKANRSFVETVQFSGR